MTIAEEYAQYCSRATYDDVPEEVREYAKKLLLDIVGVAVGSIGRVSSTDAVLQAVRRMDPDGSGGTVLGTGEQLSPPYAAMVNGTLAHSLDYDDTHRAASIHPGAPVVSAALAAAQQAGSSGRDLLTGMTVGYEVAIRMGMAVDPASHYGRGFHMTATCGLFGATAAVGSIRDLTESELTSAFGINGSQASGSLQFLENGAWNKRVHPGLAAKSALTAVTLAEEGFVGASGPIEGERGFLVGYTDSPHPEKATDGLGSEYELPKTGMKPYPCCRYMHNPVGLLIDIVDEADLTPDDVTALTVAMPDEGVKITDDPSYPESFVDAQFSMQFGAALAISRGDAGVDSFLEELEGGVSEEVRRTMDVTDVTSNDWIENQYPERWASEVIVETETGRYSRSSDHALGEPENPLSWEATVEKYESLTEPVVGTAVSSEVRKRISNVESNDAEAILAPFSEADSVDRRVETD